MLIVGGMTSVSGAVVGAIAVTVMIELLRTAEDRLNADYFGEPTVFGLTDIGLSLAILAILFWRREGLFGFWEVDELVGRWRSRFARRETGPAHAVDAPRISPEGSLAVDDVVKTFGGLRAVDGASLSLNPGEIVGLIGPNARARRHFWERFPAPWN